MARTSGKSCNGNGSTGCCFYGYIAHITNIISRIRPPSVVFNCHKFIIGFLIRFRNTADIVIGIAARIFRCTTEFKLIIVACGKNKRHTVDRAILAVQIILDVVLVDLNGIVSIFIIGVAVAVVLICSLCSNNGQAHTSRSCILIFVAGGF